MNFSTLLVDLDDTVYPASSGMWDAIAARIDLYMQVRLGIPSETIPSLRRQLHQTYGTTLRGLAVTRHIDEMDYLAFVHDIPVQEFLTPNPAVRSALQELPQRKIIFTNADSAHAGRVLRTLQLDDLFSQVIDIHTIAPYCKPMPAAYGIALEKTGVPPQECVFIDDALRNLQPAREMGVGTILVSEHSNSGSQPSCPRIASLSELPAALMLLAGQEHLA